MIDRKPAGAIPYRGPGHVRPKHLLPADKTQERDFGGSAPAGEVDRERSRPTESKKRLLKGRARLEYYFNDDDLT